MTNLADGNKKYQTAQFLHAIGTDALIVFQFALTENNDGLDMVIVKFNRYFIGKTNKQYVFTKSDQKQGGNIDSYVTMVNKLVRSHYIYNYLIFQTGFR